MRDRSKEIAMLEDTLKILKQGWYEKNGKRIQLKLSAKEMQEIQVYLPEAVKKNCSDPEFSRPFVIGRCGHGCENIDSFALARKRLGDAEARDAYLSGFDGAGMLSPGSHRVVGTLVIRTSDALSASDQKKLENRIVDALIKLE